jgi:hypothetical protein
MRLWGLTPPQWRELPEDDRDEMLEEHAAYCPSCGQLRSICSDPDAAVPAAVGVLRDRGA